MEEALVGVPLGVLLAQSLLFFSLLRVSGKRRWTPPLLNFWSQQKSLVKVAPVFPWALQGIAVGGVSF